MIDEVTSVDNVEVGPTLDCIDFHASMVAIIWLKSLLISCRWKQFSYDSPDKIWESRRANMDYGFQ
jgi:hypothetical protein